MGVNPDAFPMDCLAYAASTDEASAASIRPSLLISPSFIVMTEAVLSADTAVLAGKAVSPTGLCR